jgi:hypothetical protein
MFPTRIEVIPSDGIVEKVQAAVPLSTTLTVTCLPHHGIARTMEASARLSLLGYTVIPHLSARGLENRAQLSGILRDCEAAGISEVFAIGGDGPLGAGPYRSSLGLLADIAEYTGGSITAGIAGYPEGHPSVSGLDLLDALLAKQQLATHVVTQMCFSAPKILDCRAPAPGRRRASGMGRRGRSSSPDKTAGLGNPDRRRDFAEVPQQQGNSCPQAPGPGQVLTGNPGVRAHGAAGWGLGNPSLQFQPTGHAHLGAKRSARS